MQAVAFHAPVALASAPPEPAPRWDAQGRPSGEARSLFTASRFLALVPTIGCLGTLSGGPLAERFTPHLLPLFNRDVSFHLHCPYNAHLCILASLLGHHTRAHAVGALDPDLLRAAIATLTPALMPDGVSYCTTGIRFPAG